MNIQNLHFIIVFYYVNQWILDSINCKFMSDKSSSQSFKFVQVFTSNNITFKL